MSPRAPVEMFPPQVLGSYAFIAEAERGCLIGPRGDVAWMCTPTPWEAVKVT
jgi:alpha,alpha-trehalase